MINQRRYYGRSPMCNNWGASTVATKYIYQRIGEALHAESSSQMEQELSNLYSELAHNYQIDTGKLIGED